MAASNDQIYSAILELKGELGETKQAAKNAHEFAGNVSKKADAIRTELEEHKGDNDAHGIGGEKRGRAGIVVLVGVVSSILSAVVATIAILKFLAPKAVAG